CATAIRLFAFVRPALAVGVAWRDVAYLHKQRLIGPPAVDIATGGQSAERVAVIALTPCNEVATLRLSDLEEVLTRELERRLVRHRAAGDEVDLLETCRGLRDQGRRKFLHRLIGKEARMGKRQRRQLPLDRLHHPGVAVSKAG